MSRMSEGRCFRLSGRCVRVNQKCTDWFTVNRGLKQGCLLWPLLLDMYINDLIEPVSELRKRIDVNGEDISELIYADDIVLLAEIEEDAVSTAHLVFRE